MPTSIDYTESSVTQSLIEGDFPDLKGATVDGPKGLVPIALVQLIELDQTATIDRKQAASMGAAARLLDEARKLCRPLLFARADTLSGQHRLAEARRVTFTAAARLLVQAHAIIQGAGIALSVTTGKVYDPEGGGYRRGVVLDAAPARVADPQGRPLNGGANPADVSERATASVPPGRMPAPEAVRTAALIAAGYLARHPNAVNELPAIIREISSVLQSCGTLPTDFDDVPQFAGRLATAMPSAPTRFARHRKLRRQVFDQKMGAGA
jgi:hypothetical protein